MLEAIAPRIFARRGWTGSRLGSSLLRSSPAFRPHSTSRAISRSSLVVKSIKLLLECLPREIACRPSTQRLNSSTVTEMAAATSPKEAIVFQYGDRSKLDEKQTKNAGVRSCGEGLDSVGAGVGGPPQSDGKTYNRPR